MSDALPEGFTVEPAAKAPTAAAPQGSSTLPAGFVPAPSEQPGIVDHMVDRFKHGFSGFAAFLPTLGDAAGELNRPTGSNPEQKVMEAIGLGDVRGKIRQAIGLDEKPSLKILIKGKEPEATRVSFGKLALEGWDNLLGVKHIPVPKDVSGGPSKANEYLGTIAEFLGGSIIPGVGAVAAAERKVATAVTASLGTAASGMGAVEGKEIGRKIAPSLGISEERGAQIGEMAGSLTGPGLVGMGSQALLKSGSLLKSAARSQDITGISKEAQKAAANSLLAKDLTNGLAHAPQSEANLARSLELSKEVEGWNPTIAQASGAPGLIAMQKEVANKSGEALAKAAAADQRNVAAISKFKDKVFPGQGRTTVDPQASPLVASEGMDAARVNNTFKYDPADKLTKGYGNSIGYPQPKGTPADKLFSNFADDIPKASADRQTKFQLDMLDRAKRNPAKFTQDTITTHEGPFGGPGSGLTVQVDTAKKGNTRVQVLDADSKQVVAAANLKNGMIDSIASHPDVAGQGIGTDLLKYLDKQKLANIHEVPDRSPFFVKAQKRAITENAAEAAAPKLARLYVVDPVLDPARIKLSTNKQVMQMQVDKNAANLAKLSQQYRRSVDNEAIGDQLRAKYWEARSTAKIQQDVNLADVYSTAKKYGIVEDMTDVRDAINKIVTSERQTFQDMPTLFKKVLNEYPVATPAAVERKMVQPYGAEKPFYRTINTPANPGRSEASFEELHSLYKQANRDWADATAAGDSSKAAYMALVRDQLKAKVNKYGGPEYGDLATKFQEFNQGYAKYSNTFKEGAGGEIAKRGKGGLARDAEDIVAKTILKAGDKKKGVQDFFAVYGDDPAAAQLLRDGLLDNFSKAVMKTGTFNPKAANVWLKQHEQALGELPAMQAKLADAMNQGNMLVNRQLLLQKQSKVLDRTMLAKVAGSSNPDALIKKALGDSADGPKVLKALMVGAITPESKQSVARAIVDVVAQHPQSLDFIMSHEATLKPVMQQLGPDHWNNLKKIAEMEIIAKRVTAPTQVELSKLQDAGEQLAGTSIKGLFARTMAAKQGRISEGYAVMDVGGRFFYKIRSEEMGRLREAAMFDPDLAGLMAKLGAQKGAPTKDQLLDLQRLSFNAGVVSSAEAVNTHRDRQAGRGDATQNEGGQDYNDQKDMETLPKASAKEILATGFSELSKRNAWVDKMEKEWKEGKKGKTWKQLDSEYPSNSWYFGKKNYPTEAAAYMHYHNQDSNEKVPVGAQSYMEKENPAISFVNSRLNAKGFVFSKNPDRLFMAVNGDSTTMVHETEHLRQQRDEKLLGEKAPNARMGMLMNYDKPVAELRRLTAQMKDSPGVKEIWRSGNAHASSNEWLANLVGFMKNGIPEGKSWSDTKFYKELEGKVGKKEAQTMLLDAILTSQGSKHSTVGVRD